MSNDVYFLIEHLQGKVMDMSFVLAAAARSAVQGDGKVIAVLLGEGVQSLGEGIDADLVMYCEHPDLKEFNPEAYQLVLVNIFKDGSARALLLGDTTIGAGIAGKLSAELDFPMVSSCTYLDIEGDELRYTCKAFGGKVLTEGLIPSPTALITMIPGEYKVEAGQSETKPEVSSFDPPEFPELRVKVREYIQPEAGDVDISTVPILIAIGRGLGREDNLEMVEELAEAIGGEICASRPVVDQGWLSTTRMVGKSGKSVKPKIYLALGISGAPEHIEGMSDSDMIIAVNTDASAPIFDVAAYGAEVDILDFMPILTEKIKQAKVG